MAVAGEPVVTIIVPVYGVEPFLRQCLDSLCGQTLGNIEIIAVNDASPDGCGAILDEYARRDPRIRVMTHERNQGVSSARNAGLENARGRYICFVDGDDTIDATMYETLVDSAERVQADMVYCGIQIVREDGSLVSRVIPDDEVYDLRRVEERRKAFRRLGVSSCSKLLRRDAIRQVRFPSLVMGEDGVFLIACFCNCQIIQSVPLAPYQYLSRAQSSGKTYTMRSIGDFGRRLELTRELLLTRGYDELWSAFASEGRNLIPKCMVRFMYEHSDSTERRQLWQECLERSVPILLERGFQPGWMRWWFRMAFAPRSLWLAYWAASVPCRYEESCVGFIRTVVKSFRRRDWRAIVELCHRTTRKAYQPRSS